MRTEALKAILALFLLAVVAAMTIAEPYGPDAVTVEDSQRRTSFDGGVKQIEAQAGNVTQLTINTSILTGSWQGYYGNISGTITLDDASGHTMYDWADGSGFSPVGEIYAANQSGVTWTDVICVNLTGDGTPGQQGINVTVLEAIYGMSTGDADGIDETFTSTEDVVIGTTILTACPATYIYQSDDQVEGTWNETLLTENSTGAVIFAAEVEQDTLGFDDNPWDFQMIVGENGGDSETTTYYFYVELA